jgi:hypothetical protein
MNCHPERTEPDSSGELMTEGNNIVEGRITSPQTAFGQ